MSNPDLLRVAVLVDLPRTALSGGHVKCWERLALATAQANLPLDLTVYFSGSGPDEIIGPQTRFRYLPPVFPTSKLKFLPYVPDHTDLAPYHPQLARELAQFDVIHTTDGFFAFARTAARVSHARGIPLVNSIHTDTPSYATIFTRHTIEKVLGSSGIRGDLARVMINDWKLPERQGRSMERKLRHHMQYCRYALVTRKEDEAFAANVLGSNNIYHMRRGIDKQTFGPHQRDRAGVERDYGIPPGQLVVLFAGRVDVGKNIYTLVEAMETLLSEGHPLHLIVAGVGPAMKDVKNRLGTHASVPGFIVTAELARLYASADVLAVPSEVETHSMVGVEAITSGCPILIARKSGVAELFHDTPAMRVVDSGVEAWLTALRDFSSRQDQHVAMRDAAVQYSQDHLTGWREVLAEDFLSVWQKAALPPPLERDAA